MDARSMQLVVLMACEGARTSGRDGFPGVGQALVRQGLPAVVAMQTEISDRAALVFNHDFYAAAAQGLGTEAAISTVRLAMAASDQASEWGTPVLYRGSTDSWRLNITPPAEPNAHSVRVVGHTRAVTAVATARLEDGRPVAVTGSRDATVRVWDLQSGTTLGGALTGHTAEVTGVATAIMPDGSVVAVTGSRDATLRVWDLQSGTPLGAPFAGLDAVTAISTAVMPDGRVVAVAGGRDAQVRTWDLRTGRLIGKFVTGHTDRVTALATATLPDGRIAVVTSGFDPTVRVWELASGVPLREPLATGADTIWALATAELADGRLVAVAGADDGTVHVLDMQERSGANRLSGHTAAVEAAATAVLPSGRVVAVTGDRAGSLRAWDLHSMSVLGEPSTGHPEAIWALAGSSLRDGRTVAVAGRDDGTVEVVNLAYLESLPSPELDAVEVELGEAEPSAEAMQSSSDADAASESPSTGQAAQPKGRFRRLLDALGGRDRPAEAETQTPTPASSSTLTRTSRGTRTTNSSTETFTVDYTVSGQRLELVSGGRGAVKTTVGPLGSEQPRSFDGVVVTVGELLFESDEVVVRAIDQALSLDGGWREADSEASRFPTTRIAEQVGHIVGELTSVPVSDVLIGGWKQHEGLMEAADRTSGVPPTAEWIELGSHGIAWSRNPSFTVSLDSQTVFTGGAGHPPGARGRGAHTVDRRRSRHGCGLRDVSCPCVSDRLRAWRPPRPARPEFEVLSGARSAPAGRRHVPAPELRPNTSRWLSKRRWRGCPVRDLEVTCFPYRRSQPVTAPTAVSAPVPAHLWSPVQRARLVRLCAAIVGDPSVAEDLAQETLLEAWRLQHRLTDPSGADAWAGAIARNVCRRWLRARGTLPVPTAHPGDNETRDLDSVLEREEVVDLLDRALGLLPAQTRDVLVGHYVEQLSHAQLAERLGTTSDAVSMRISRGRVRLRYLLETRFAEDGLAESWTRRGEGGWRGTRLRCPTCGGRGVELRHDHTEVAFRCRTCDLDGLAARLPLDAPTFAAVVGDVRRPSALEARIGAWTHTYWNDVSPACVRCAQPVQPQTYVREDVDRWTHRHGWYAACDACGEVVSGSVAGRVLALPAVRAARRRDPLLRLLPAREVVRDGAPTAVVSLGRSDGTPVVSAVLLRDSLRLVHVG